MNVQPSTNVIVQPSKVSSWFSVNDIKLPRGVVISLVNSIISAVRGKGNILRTKNSL